ncbi:hypothetical protein GCM10011333_29590 [Sediminivirga luteola]|uniref:Uncharacterized protein n=1 Tax=Sediminivirga luteola TaxID=1774748 RepID=A0A8J2XK31_9MICO|nr:hypothetical protein GCM10011333_29590 [Sediminivirga luteola]
MQEPGLPQRAARPQEGLVQGADALGVAEIEPPHGRDVGICHISDFSQVYGFRQCLGLLGPLRPESMFSLARPGLN